MTYKIKTSHIILRLSQLVYNLCSTKHIDLWADMGHVYGDGMALPVQSP